MAARTDMNEPTQQAVREYVRLVLQQTGWTATELARRIRVAPSTIGRFINDRRVKHVLSLRTIAAIAATSGVPLPEDQGFPSTGQEPAKAASATAPASPAVTKAAAAALYDGLFNANVWTDPGSFGEMLLTLIRHARTRDGKVDAAHLSDMVEVAIAGARRRATPASQ
ncbi:MAG: helix-turn-helix domain-containing protein [Planctomycetes bacterium]|nr:helix-turn-helix domain-containing protein [Planctomycetota bacterium]